MGEQRDLMDWFAKPGKSTKPTNKRPATATSLPQPQAQRSKVDPPSSPVVPAGTRKTTVVSASDDDIDWELDPVEVVRGSHRPPSPSAKPTSPSPSAASPKKTTVVSAWDDEIDWDLDRVEILRESRRRFQEARKATQSAAPAAATAATAKATGQGPRASPPPHLAALYGAIGLQLVGLGAALGLDLSPLAAHAAAAATAMPTTNNAAAATAMPTNAAAAADSAAVKPATNAATKPAAAKPATAKSAAATPATNAATKPAATKPAATKPAAATPATNAAPGKPTTATSAAKVTLEDLIGIFWQKIGGGDVGVLADALKALGALSEHNRSTMGKNELSYHKLTRKVVTKRKLYKDKAPYYLEPNGAVDYVLYERVNPLKPAADPWAAAKECLWSIIQKKHHNVNPWDWMPRLTRKEFDDATDLNRLSPVARRIIEAIQRNPQKLRDPVFWLSLGQYSLNTRVTRDWGRPKAGNYFGVGCDGRRICLGYSGRAQETILRFLEHMLETNLSGVSADFTMSPFYKLAKKCKWMLFFPLYEESLDESTNSQATDGKSHFKVVAQRIAILEALFSILLGTCQVNKALLEVRAKYGLPHLGNSFKGGNGTPCFETPWLDPAKAGETDAGAAAAAVDDTDAAAGDLTAAADDTDAAAGDLTAAVDDADAAADGSTAAVDDADASVADVTSSDSTVASLESRVTLYTLFSRAGAKYRDVVKQARSVIMLYACRRLLKAEGSRPLREGKYKMAPIRKGREKHFFNIRLATAFSDTLRLLAGEGDWALKLDEATSGDGDVGSLLSLNELQRKKFGGMLLKGRAWAERDAWGTDDRETVMRCVMPLNEEAEEGLDSLATCLEAASQAAREAAFDAGVAELASRRHDDHHLLSSDGKSSFDGTNFTSAQGVLHLPNGKNVTLYTTSTKKSAFANLCNAEAVETNIPESGAKKKLIWPQVPWRLRVNGSRKRGAKPLSPKFKSHWVIEILPLNSDVWVPLTEAFASPQNIEYLVKLFEELDKIINGE